MTVGTLPAALKIGNQTYALGTLTEESTEKYSGRGNRMAGWIRLHPDLTGVFLGEVLWHEIIHQVLEQGEFKDANADEKLIERLSCGVSGVLLDNPELVKWMQELAVQRAP